ncbi:choice-of-anchor I family protein [Shewanella rhizosphaerae]|uniref:choice-of-anchor I family protein n=1 Tax=Shewanella rhizosphaerae TaxID=2864207 RepID=UPI001C65F410|nr:choice-of-anchor I family protein [Shewanella rhizosphaerae]QYK14620.1 choice-of-anchor I family protein [Shewanella rhizosphaerae]
MNNKMNKTAIAVVVATLGLTACSGDDGKDGANGSNGTNGASSLVAFTQLPAGDLECPLGGQMIQTGLDLNGNGVLDSDEVNAEQTQYLCRETVSGLSAELVGRYESGVYGQSAAEIVGFHVASKRIFVVNAQSGMVDIVDAANLAAIPVAGSDALVLNNLPKQAVLDVAQDLGLARLGGVNSLAIYGDLLAVAIERGDEAGNGKQGMGYVAFYHIDSAGEASLIHGVEVGALPDNVVFSHDGKQVLVAGEGEPSDDYSVDPLGTVAIIAVTDGVPATSATLLDFSDFNLGGAREAELSSDIKINGPGASRAQDLEPEYISVSPDDKLAYVSLQENNAIAVIDIPSKAVKAIWPLGFKDFGLAKNAIDASDKDDRVNIQAYPGVVGLYQPDTIASYQWHGSDFVVTANEGDSRDYGGFSEEARADDLTLDANHPQFAAAQDKTQLARLKVTTSMGDEDGDGDFDKIVAYGGRSFSIWDQNGQQVFDSGSDFSRITAALLGMNFNNNNEENKGDSRSDDKGAEPEALAIGEIEGKRYAFIGLERTSGFMIYEITNPFAVKFVDYVVNRDFEVGFEIDGSDITGSPGAAGDLGPEGMSFVAAADSPNGKPLLIIGNEVSGSTSVYQLSLQ